MAAERPRRSIRVPAKYQDTQKEEIHTVSPSTSKTSKRRKASPTRHSHEDPSSLDFLLTNPKSPLVNLDLSKIINQYTWLALTSDSQALLSTMLPPAVFPFFRPSLDPNHPANRKNSEDVTETSKMNVDSMVIGCYPDPSFLTDPFFKVGIRTFQDHLYSGWLTPDHDDLVREYKEKLQRGEIHAPWKDEVWSEEHPVAERTISDTEGPAGEASSVTLKDLAKHAIIRVGDVLAYRRHFSQSNCTVAKDVLIHSIRPGAHSLTVLVAPSTQIHLPLSYLQHSATVEQPQTEDTDLLSMTIANPSQLESALLDINGSIEKSRRPNANAWKMFSLWRWGEGQVPEPSAYPQDAEDAARGYREYRGSLFYLRGCFYDDF